MSIHQVVTWLDVTQKPYSNVSIKTGVYLTQQGYYCRLDTNFVKICPPILALRHNEEGRICESVSPRTLLAKNSK